ncbi:SpoIIE family protein phosphatase [Tunturibacter empetritectus]|uniref:Sigma-B regulation protein RsbU (Phosphoserine phosphatase) n=1 Tax=Tunturiibacter empetritectus TaxID=3069691 RepID=A0A7W8ILH6_9BACT|nr:SpoIIE family protein phosphatase [Edaphobacter lichenicola]MBB5318353.1 sigma-B regulation protein RsbU (phosphoserine phosphatase) [Edaphobacter lichenicola]
MPQRSARLQYLLLALVAALALLHAYGGAILNFNLLAHGDSIVRSPFESGLHLETTTDLREEALAAGLRPFDTILTINGQPYTSRSVLLDQTRHASPGDSMTVTYRRGPDGPGGAINSATIKLAPNHPQKLSPLAIAVRLAFAVLPLFCLLIGLWVVFARPRNPHAWLILGILCYFDALFINPTEISGSYLVPIALFWNIVAQTAMPLCLMFFGVYFPERSTLDIKLPWVKWLFAIPILILAPTDVLYYFGDMWSFASIRWLAPYLYSINTAENVISALAICWFFITLGPKIGQATGDARRRLRVLYVGTSIGLTPFFLLLLYSLYKRSDFGQDIPQWVDVTVFLILLLFPLSLAYVVIVQRAMDLRIIIRQGTRYAFARESLTVVRVGLAIWLAFSLNDFFKHPDHQRNDIIRIFCIVAVFFAFRFLLSKRLQLMIDQRFFREAYSTEQLLSELSDQARNFTEVAPLLETITRRLSSTLHIDRIAVFLRSGDTFHLQLATGMPMTPDAAQFFSLPAASTTIKALSRAKAPANVYRDDPSSWLIDATDAERNALNDLSTELLVPLPGRTRLAGVIALGPKSSEEPYTKTDRQLLQTIASQTGLALENAELIQNLTNEVAQRERISREIEIAREVQERLFPQTYPKLPGVDLAGFCRPAQAVGGDYYDFFLLPSDSTTDSRLALALGDISGKGISAALLMASLRASLRSIAGLQQADLAALLSHVNHVVYESSTTNRYATFFYAEYDPINHLLTYVNAGHNPPYVLRGAETITLEPTGTVVGLLPNAEYSQATLQMHPGDVLLAFTDGISEAMNHSDEEWGEDNMLAAARQLLSRPDCTTTAGQLLTCILDAADKFTAGAPQHDDMTLLVCTIARTPTQ